MSTCIRNGTTYKRHKYKNGICKGCGTAQSEQLKQLALRRADRRQAKVLKRSVEVASAMGAGA